MSKTIISHMFVTVLNPMWFRREKERKGSKNDTGRPSLLSKQLEQEKCEGRWFENQEGEGVCLSWRVVWTSFSLSWRVSKQGSRLRRNMDCPGIIRTEPKVIGSTQQGESQVKNLWNTIIKVETELLCNVNCVYGKISSDFCCLCTDINKWSVFHL